MNSTSVYFYIYVAIVSTKVIHRVPENKYIIILDLDEPDEGYSRNVSCTLIYISTFLFSKKRVMHTNLYIYIFIFKETCHAH